MTNSTIIHPLKLNFEIPVSDKIKLPRFVNLFILAGEKIHFIDTGVADGITQIESFLNELGRTISETETILLTHSHPDHIGAAKLIQEKSGCKIIATNEERTWIEDTELQFKQRPVPGFHKLVSGPVKIDLIAKTSDYIKLEKNINIQVISTPGHSTGSTSFLLKEENALFTGDAVLLPGEIPIFEEIESYLKSLEKIIEINPDFIFSAWDKPQRRNEIPEILEKSKNYILYIQNTARKVATRVKNIQTMEFCRSVLTELGLPENISNPLVLKSFLSSLR